MALNSLFCAAVPLRNYTLTHVNILAQYVYGFESKNGFVCSPQIRADVPESLFATVCSRIELSDSIMPVV